MWALRRGAIPAGRITSNAGAEEHKPATSTINCTVSGIIQDSMHGILDKVHEAGLTLKAGCGIGYEFSTLRPKGAYVSGATVIQGKGLALAERRESASLPRSPLSTNFMNKIKEDMIWIQKAGDDLLASFILPPLQVIAAAINFCTLLVSGKHLFELPIKSMADAIPIGIREKPEPKIVNGNRTTRHESLTHIK